MRFFYTELLDVNLFDMRDRYGIGNRNAYVFTFFEELLINNQGW